MYPNAHGVIRTSENSQAAQTEPQASSPTLRVDGLTYHFGDTRALNDVNLSIRQGEICGLIGRNGAGKTTLISIVAGVRRPHSGRVFIDGEDISEVRSRTRLALGLAGQDVALYPTVSIRDNLRLFAELGGVRSRDLHTAVTEVAQMLDLASLIDTPVRELSGGEQRRAHAAAAMVHKPRLLILDEPTTGVDIETRARLLDAIHHLSIHNGTSVLYSTHYLPEIERLRASVAVLHQGRIHARGHVSQLVKQYAESCIHMVFKCPAPDHLTRESIRVSGRDMWIRTREPAQDLPRVLTQLGRSTRDLNAIDFIDASLETAFLALTTTSELSTPQ